MTECYIHVEGSHNETQHFLKYAVIKIYIKIPQIYYNHALQWLLTAHNEHTIS